MKRISTRFPPLGVGAAVIVHEVYVSSPSSNSTYRLTYTGLGTFKDAGSAALRCAVESAPAGRVRTASGLIVDVLSGRQDVRSLLTIVGDSVWNETGIELEITYDESTEGGE